MRGLITRFRREGRVLPGGLPKVTRFLTPAHDPSFAMQMRGGFAGRLPERGMPAPTCLLGAEVAAIAVGRQRLATQPMPRGSLAKAHGVAPHGRRGPRVVQER